MRTKVIAWSGGVPGFGDCRPDGRYAVNVVERGVIVTDTCDVPLPDPAGADYIRLPASGPRILCQGQSDGRAHEWDGQQWHDLAPAYGPHAVIYDAADQRRVLTDAATYQLYGGYRFVDVHGQIVGVIQSNGTAEEGLREWTDCGPFKVGQGQEDGTVVLFSGDVPRLLQSGDSMFITARLVGDQVAICVVNDSQHQTTLTWATVEELKALPAVVKPQPVPLPPPPPNPNLAPEPKPMSFPNHLDVVQRERAKFPSATLSEAQCFAVTNAVAADPAVKADGWGLTKAPAGATGYVVNGQNYRLDKLCHPSGFINDILSDTPGAAGAQWGPNADPNGNAANWAPAIPNVGTTVPDPGTPAQPPSQPPMVDLQPLKDQIAALEARLSALEQKPAPDDFATHGGIVNVEVTGSVSLSDVIYARKVNWSGKGVIQ